MKNFKIFLALITVTSLAVTGCKEDLAITPSDTIDANTVFVNVADLETGAVGVYAGLDNPDIALSARLSDENYYPIENNANVSGLSYRWEIDPDLGDIATAWSPNYTIIYRANRILRVIDAIPTTSTAEVTQKARIKGEMLALRAFVHLQILKAYAENYTPTGLGIPYLSDFEDDPRKSLPARTTVGDNFSKILADLASAKSLMPSNFANVNRITLKAISAIEARVFLYQKDWDKAIVAATEVINGTPLATRAQFPGIWTDANNSEVIWKLKRESGSSAIGTVFRNTAGLVYLAAAPKLINSYDQSNDIRFNSYIKIDNDRTANQTKNLVVKYVGSSGLVNINDLKLFRTSEAYLIRAEAYAQKNRYQDAVNDINDLREARITGHVDAAAYSGTPSAIADIYSERFKELAYEGHRYFDLRRQGMAIDRNPIASDDNSSGKLTLLPTAKEYILPVPGPELRSNPNMDQTPIWKL